MSQIDVSEIVQALRGVRNEWRDSQNRSVSYTHLTLPTTERV